MVEPNNQNESNPISIIEKKPNPLITSDKFVAAVPWDDWRTVLLHHRQHGGYEYIRFRTWNLHRTKLVWYPTKRGFVIPVQNATALADALLAGANGDFQAKPDWFVEHERVEWDKAVAKVRAAMAKG